MDKRSNEMLRFLYGPKNDVRKMYGDFAHDLATLVIGVDTMWGGDILQESGSEHFIADTWTSDAKPPEIYWSEQAQELREKGGVLGGASIGAFSSKYNLDKLVGKTIAAGLEMDSDRGRYLVHLGQALDTMISTAYAIYGKWDLPAFETRYKTGTGKDFEGWTDAADARERLRNALKLAGYETTPSRDLRETFIAWENARLLAPEEIAGRANEFIMMLLGLTKKQVLKRVLKPGEKLGGHRHDLSDVSLDGIEFRTIGGAHFTGSLAYRGGKDESGRALLKGLYEYNKDHPLTEAGLLHLCSHELCPGHALNMAFIDLLHQDRKIEGFEATLGTMCTPSATFQEGWAENAFRLLFGSVNKACEYFDGTSAGLGTNLRVALARAYLESIGKHNAPMWHADGMSDDEILRRVAEECVQTDVIAKKLLRWAKHPIMGPMYAPGYLIGTDTVREALTTHPRMEVARAGLNLDGLVDNETFRQRFKA